MTDYSMAMMAGRQADSLIAGEIELQDKMWGIANDRADNFHGEMVEAAVAQATLVVGKQQVDEAEVKALIEEIRTDIYPPGWSGFRDYGSDIANLVVAAAFLRQEIKRKLIAGEDTTRAARPKDQPYTGDQPNKV